MSASAAALRSGPPGRERRMPASASVTAAPPGPRCGGTWPAQLWWWAMAASARATEGGRQVARCQKREINGEQGRGGG